MPTQRTRSRNPGPIDPKALSYLRTPADIGVYAWYKASSLALADGATTTTWADSAGNGFGLSGATATYHTNQINGKPALTWGSSYMATSGNIGISGSAARSMYAIVKFSDVSTRASFLGWGCTFSNDQMWQWTVQSSSAYVDIWNTNSSGVSVSTGAWYLIYGILSSGTLYRGSNLASQASSGLSVNTCNTSLYVGFGPNTGFTAVFSGQFAELALFNKALNSTEQADISNYFNDEYGLAAA